MKKIFTLCAVALLYFTAARSQYFLGDLEIKDDTVIYKIKAVGNFKGNFADLEIFIRWDETYNTTFSPPILTHSCFPELGYGYIFNDPCLPDPGYQTLWILVMCPFGKVHTFTDGTVYELFRTKLTSDIPPLIQLVAENTTCIPYYFCAAAGLPTYADHTAYDPISPFVNETGSQTPFFYKDFPMANSAKYANRREFKQINTTPLSQKELKSHIDSMKLYFQERARNAKLFKPAIPAVLVYPNPVDNHSVSIDLMGVDKQSVQISIQSLSGGTIKTYTRVLHDGQNTLELQLPEYLRGIYFVNIKSGGKNISSQKILVQ